METATNLRAELRAAIVAEDSEGVLGRVDQILFKDDGILNLTDSRETEDLSSPTNVVSTEGEEFDALTTDSCDAQLNMEQNRLPGSQTNVLNSSEEHMLDRASCFAVEGEDIPHNLRENEELDGLNTLDTNIPKTSFSDKIVEDESSDVIDRNRGSSSMEKMEDNEGIRSKTDHVLHDESSLSPNSTRHEESKSLNTEHEDNALEVLNATDANMELIEDENVVPECVVLDSSEVAEMDSAVSFPGGAESLQENETSTRKEKFEALNTKGNDSGLNEDIEALVLSKPKTVNGSAEDTLDSAGNKRDHGRSTTGEFLF